MEKKIKMDILSRMTVVMSLILIFTFFLGGLVLNPMAASAVTEEEQEDVWDKFKEVATDEFYNALDEQFANISGVSVQDKVNKIEDAIETAQKFINYFNDVLGAEPSRKANIDALQSLADGISGIADLVNKLPEPGPSLASFFTFYAEGINAAVRMLEALSAQLQEEARLAAELGDWYISIRPGAISDEEIATFRRLKKQEQVARRAKARVEAKKAQMEAKMAQITEFTETGYTYFINAYVQEVQNQAGKEHARPSALDKMVRELKRKYNQLFEQTDPRDALEAQYSRELDDLLAGGKDTIAGSAEYFSILRDASNACQSAENELTLVSDIPDRKDDSAIRANITETRNKIDELKIRAVSFEGEVTTYDGTLGRFDEISTEYQGLKGEADPILAEAQGILTQAKAYREEVLEDWENSGSDEQAGAGQAGIPYGISLSVAQSTLSADEVTALLRGYSRTTQAVITVPTVVSRQVLIEVTENEQTILKRFYELSEGAVKTSSSMAVDKSGIISLSGNQVEGVGGGTATLTASVDGYLSKPSLGQYTPEAYAALKAQRGKIEAKQDVEVYEFTRLKFDVRRWREIIDFYTHSTAFKHDVRETDLFISEYALVANRAEMKIIFQFRDPNESLMDWTGLSQEDFSKYVKMESEDEAVIPPGEWSDSEHYNTTGLYMVDAGNIGESTLTFSIVNGSNESLYAQEFFVTVSKVHLTFFDELGALVGWGCRPGQMIDMVVEIEGPADMTLYVCFWKEYKENPEPNEVRAASEYTRFVGRKAFNHLIVPVQICPSARIEVMDILDREQNDQNEDGNVYEFRGGARITPPELTRLVLQFRHQTNTGTDESPRWMGDLANEPVSMTKTHLFNWDTYSTMRNRPIDVLEKGFFTVLRATDVCDEFNPHFIKNTEAKSNPAYSNFLSLETINMYDPYNKYASNVLTKKQIRMTYYGTAEVWLEAPASDDSWFYNKEFMSSINKLTVYVDHLELDYPLYEELTLTGGHNEVVRLKAQSEGDLSDYEVLWVLNPDTGGFQSEVTEFVRDDDINWHSENLLQVPKVPSLKIRAWVRKKGTNVKLGGDYRDVEITFSYDLSDAVKALQILTGITPVPTLALESDVNGDGRIGLEEAIYILQKVADLRE